MTNHPAMTSSLHNMFSLVALALVASTSWGQVVWTEPAFPTQNDVVTLYYDVAAGNAALVDEEPPCPPCPFVYAHTGVITSESDSPSDWQYVHNPWPNGSNGSQANNGNALLPVSGTVHSFDFGGMTLAEYYGVPDGVVIEQLAFVFRNGDGTVVGKTADEGDIFHNVSDGSFEVIFTAPFGSILHSTFGEHPLHPSPGNARGLADPECEWRVGRVCLRQRLDARLGLGLGGRLRVGGCGRGRRRNRGSHGLRVCVAERPPVLAPPAGTLDGINHVDESTVILQWTAPYKDFVFAVGDFNDWSIGSASMMHDAGDGETFWIELTGLTPGEPPVTSTTSFLTTIDTPDAYAEVILDQWNDPWIPETTYPDMLPYPNEVTSGPVSVFTPGEPVFEWTDEDFTRPDQENLVIYELLVRDFSEARTFQFIEDSLDYLASLGVQAWN